MWHWQVTEELSLKADYIISSHSTMNSNFHSIRLIRILLFINGEYYKGKAVDLPQR